MRSMNHLKWHVIKALTEMSIKLIAYHLLQAILEIIQEIALIIKRFTWTCKPLPIMVFYS